MGNPQVVLHMLEDQRKGVRLSRNRTYTFRRTRFRVLGLRQFCTMGLNDRSEGIYLARLVLEGTTLGEAKFTHTK